MQRDLIEPLHLRVEVAHQEERRGNAGRRLPTGPSIAVLAGATIGAGLSLIAGPGPSIAVLAGATIGAGLSLIAGRNASHFGVTGCPTGPDFQCHPQLSCGYAIRITRRARATMKVSTFAMR
jgi:hypothetical protein